MIRRIELLTALLAIALLSGFGPQEAGAGAPARGAVRVLSSSAGGMTIRVDAPWQSLRVEPAPLAGQAYVRAAMPGWSSGGDAGRPALPLQAWAIGVPYGAGIRLQVVPGPAHVLALPAPLAPDPGDPSAAYPGVLARVTADGVIRGQRVAAIAAYPVQYRPASRELAVYEWLEIHVSFDDAAAAASNAQNPQPLGPVSDRAPSQSLGPVSDRAPSQSLGPVSDRAPAPAPQEAEAYENLFRRGLLNYEAARAWRRPVAGRGAGRGQDAAPSPQGWTPPAPGWRVMIREGGMHRLAYGDLLAAGLPVDALDPRTLQVLYRGDEVAIYVSGEADGRLDPGDYLLFYGQALNSKYTADNVYWLTYGRGPGLRMGTRHGAPGDGAAADHYRASLHLEANRIYRTRSPGDDALDRWLWDYVYPPGKPGWSHTFALPAPYEGPYTAALTLAMLGGLDDRIDPDHHAKVLVNGIEVEDARWDGQAWRIAEIRFPQSYLRAGDNTISVVCPGDTGAGADLVYIDRADLEFADTFRAEGDRLAFTADAAGERRFEVGGFTSGQVAAYDVTDPAAVVRIEGVSVTPAGGGYVARFRDAAALPASYWVGTPAAYRGAQAIEADAASDLRSGVNGADYIVITHAVFAAEAAALADFRRQQGLRAEVVDVQDVYDEFGYGVVAAEAIRSFLAHAYASWQPPAPSYVVLLGDGHYDPKDYLGYGPAAFRPSYVPPYLAAVDPWIGETAADNRYVAVAGGDPFPDMMLGRLPANSRAEAAALVDKIISYETSAPSGEWRQQLLAVADNADSAGDFAAISDNMLARHLPASIQAARVYEGVTHPDIDAARAAIRAGFDAGKLIVAYTGHAAVTAWASEGLFKAGDVPALQNGSRLPVVLAMTCYDGYFLYPYPYRDGAEATGEVLVRAAGRGAVASWSPTGLGVATGHEVLAGGFLDAVFRDEERTLGAATTAGMLALWARGTDLDLIDTYLLFGDPATRLALAPAAAPVAPAIAVQGVPGAGSARLTWPDRIEDPAYEVWRGTTPYFDPARGGGNQVALVWGDPGGSAGEVSYTDDGIDRYFSLPNDPPLEPVALIGDAASNYFWVVRGRSGEAVSGNSNRVGEFGFSLAR